MGDDDEPADLAWLKAVGFGRHMQPAAGNDLSIQSDDSRRFRVLVMVNRPTPDRPQWEPSRWAVNEMLLAESATPTTRGAVRRLCAALGIPLTQES